MELALGLVATFSGVALVLAGYTKRPFARLMFGFWDSPGASGQQAALPPAPATAVTGGVHAPQTAAGAATVGAAVGRLAP